MIKRLVFIVMFLFALPCWAANLQIHEAWIKDLPAVVPVRAGYMTIVNRQAQKVIIESLVSESFARIEIHQTVEDNGLMSMRPVELLTIEPGETLKLAPGGMHLMMMNPLKPLKPGNKIAVTISYNDQSTQTIELIVRK